MPAVGVAAGDAGDGVLEFDGVLFFKESAFGQTLGSVVREVGLRAAAPFAHELGGAAEFSGVAIGGIAGRLVLGGLSFRAVEAAGIAFLLALGPGVGVAGPELVHN